MPANQYGIDMGEIYRTTEAVKGARTANKLAALNLSEKESEIASRPAKAALRGKAVAGDEEAARSLLALDPQNAPAFLEAVAGMDERKRAEVKRNVDQMGRISSYVLQGGTPEEQARRYSAFRSGLPVEQQDKMPIEYNPQFMELSMAKALEMDKILEAPKVVSAGTKEQHYKLGQKVGEFNKPVSGKGSGGRGGPGGGVKSGDESLIYKQSAELLGGIFDQSGNLTNLDPESRNKIQQIATEAANIFQSKGNVTRSEAVKQAAKKFGFNIQDAPEQGADNDPLGLL